MSPTPTDPNQAQAWITGDPPDQTIDFYIPRGNTGPMGPQGPIGPSLVVGDVITNMGPAAPGTVGPQGATGPKGDPGGLVAATSLSGSPDLNTIVTPGTYRNIDNTQATSALNYPVGGVALNLLVIATGPSIVTQIGWPINGAYGSRVQWVRSFNATWSPWRAINSTRIDNTVGRVIYQWDDLTMREQIIYGDTGARSIGDILLNGWTAAAASEVSVRRFNSTVFIDGKVGSGAATSDLMFSLSNGFRPRTQDQAVINGALSGGVGTWKYARVRWDGNIYLDRTSVGTLYISGSWSTVDPWPTTLPGAALGSIPNV